MNEQSNRVTYMSLNNRVYDSEQSLWQYCILITYTLCKKLHLCPNIYTHYPSKQNGQFARCKSIDCQL